MNNHILNSTLWGKKIKRSLPLISFVFLVIVLFIVLRIVFAYPRTFSVKSSKLRPLYTYNQKDTAGSSEVTDINYWHGDSACPNLRSREVPTTLHMREDGSFRIMVFTDLHFSCGHTCEVDHKTQLLIDSLLDIERPDLVVFNGDMIQSEGGSRKLHFFMDVFAPVARRDIDFAVIFGNHDSDGPFVMSRDDMVKYLFKCEHSITMSPREFLINDGNYLRTLKGKRMTTNLYFLDTYRDSMKRTQVDWLRDKIVATPKENTLASLVFMHIPPKEFISNMCTKLTDCNGLYGERAESGSSHNGFYDVFKMMKGKVRGIISGHDHKNDLCSVSDKNQDAVEVLCYARASGYGGYGAETLLKGARVIHLNENTNRVYSYVVNELGERQQLLHFSKSEEL